VKNIITKIEVQKKNKDRVNIFINDEFRLGCSSELIYRHGLEKGKNIDIEYLNSIVLEDEYIRGKNYALKYIERSYKTEKQIYDYLVKKEFKLEVISRIMSFLNEYGFMNDNKYAELYIKERIKKEGRKKIRYSLLKKGISEEIIIEKLNIIDNQVIKEAALKLAEKKYKILVNSETNKAKILNKLNNFLAGKGYEFPVINAVLNEVTKNIDNEIKIIVNENNKDDYNKKMQILNDIACKRYRIIIKSESDMFKIKKKLQDYLLRKGYSYDEIKKVFILIDNGEYT
jgi:regulatory protein